MYNRFPNRPPALAFEKINFLNKKINYTRSQFLSKKSLGATNKNMVPKNMSA